MIEGRRFYTLIFPIICLLAISSRTVLAQRCGASCSIPEGLLGAPEQLLVATLPELKRLPNTINGSGILLGKWLLDDLYFASLPFTATFHIKGNKVDQIKLHSLAPFTECAQRNPLRKGIEFLSKTYGRSLIFGNLSNDETSRISVKTAAIAFDISIHFSLTKRSCSTDFTYEVDESRNPDLILSNNARTNRMN